MLTFSLPSFKLVLTLTKIQKGVKIQKKIKKNEKPKHIYRNLFLTTLP
jgi:hypothetical protein